MKTKILRKLGLLLVTVMICQVFLSGCAKEITPANEVASAFSDLMISGKTEGAKTILGYTDEEIKEVMDIQEQEAIKVTKGNLSLPGLYEATDEDAKAMYVAQMDAFKKLTFTSEVTESDKENATVVMKTNYYDVATLDEQSLDAALESFGLENMVDEASAAELIQLYIKTFGETMQAAAPSTEQREITVQFEKAKVDIGGKTKTMWVPKDPEKFGSDLVSAASGVK